jgi:hypothetical protein
MIGRWNLWVFLTNAEFRQALFLTLLLFAAPIGSHCHANSYSADEQQRIRDVENYIREQGLQSVRLLPDEMRGAIGFVSNNLKALSATASIGNDSGNQSADPTPSASDGMPFSVAPDFHHKGFLPTKDALLIRLGFSRKAIGDKLLFTAHPFYGQNWRSLRGYWGAEMSMLIDKRDDNLPSGALALTYTGGNEQLMDNGRGIDLHGDIDLTEGWNLTSGLRQNSLSGSSNYVMLRWKLTWP